MSNIITDYSQYNEKQLHNFLNSIEKQLLKAEGDKNKAIKKIQECELQERMIRQVLAQKHSQEKEPNYLKSDQTLKNLSTTTIRANPC